MTVVEATAHRVAAAPATCQKCSSDLLRVGDRYVSCYICGWDVYLAPPLVVRADGRKNRFGAR